ncbi:carboxypeptidase-like regulatory domain-containing protein [Bacteroides sp. UBA939]|uniref:carboxypeptidase-like regulatory domain-containing protein n=1 Tax=Bacteroides sp. UBA939 TaxID=1946092 RepID=UPI0025C43B91|nr:carboxypeptidase-like regulatory domain-containing protein [Bacteroides sp. UBA939]
MKTIAFILYLCIGILPIAAQHTALEKRISVALNAVPMEESIERIAEAANIHVSYSSDLLSGCTSVTLHAQNELLLTVLNQLLAPYKISYTIHSGQLILFPKRTMVVKEYTLKGNIYEEATQEPIAYATLQIKGKSKGVVADHKGFFELNLTEMELADSLTASCVGYERRTFLAKSLVSNSGTTIGLKEKLVNIEAVTVTEAKLRKKNKSIGNRNWLTAGSIYLDTHGQQIALYIENDKQVNGYIRKVSYHLSDKGNVEAPFRVRVLTADSLNQSPGKDLLPEILVVQPPQDTDGWYDVDLSEYRIRIPSTGFFVGMQGVFPNDYSFYAGDAGFIEIGKRQPENKDDFMPKSIHYGQRVSYSDKKGRNTWHYSLSHQWFQMERHNYNVKISAEIEIYSK